MTLRYMHIFNIQYLKKKLLKALKKIRVVTVLGMEAQIENITRRMQETRDALEAESSRARELESKLNLSRHLTAEKN